MMRILFLSFVVVMIGLGACQSKQPSFPTLDLLSDGLPLKILAPEDVVVTTSDLGIMKDVTVRNESGYTLQIFESDAKQLDIKKLVEELKTDVQASEFFSSIVSENENGFIFEKKIGEDYINYDFRSAKILGSKQYVIQAGISSKNSLEQAEIMFNSVQ